jgi:hypothetical protein
VNALGRVVNTKSGMVHRKDCSMLGYRENVKPLSTVPANKRNKLSKCLRCKP